LYNARTGKLEVEAHTPNIIYPEVYAWLKSYQWRKFAENAYNNSISDMGYWEMDNIYLTTSDQAENVRVDMWNFDVRNVSGATPGATVGWSNKSTYVGSDTKRGTPNAAESYANNTRIHWVFDWPTNACNGTFQSIIWANQLEPYFVLKSDKNIGKSTDNWYCGFSIAFANGIIYAAWNTNIIYKYNIQTESVTEINIGITQGGWNIPFGIYVFNNIIYVIDCWGTIHTYNAISGELIETIPTELSEFTTGTPGEAAHYGIIVKNNTIYILYRSNIKQGICEITHNGLVVNPVALDFVNYAYHFAYDGTYFYTERPYGNIVKFTRTGVKIAEFAIPGNSDGSTSGYGFCVDTEQKYIYTLSYIGNFRKITNETRYFARTLLASPVTKTDQQTMKIQYDFVYGE